MIGPTEIFWIFTLGAVIGGILFYIILGGLYIYAYLEEQKW